MARLHLWEYWTGLSLLAYPLEEGVAKDAVLLGGPPETLDAGVEALGIDEARGKGGLDFSQLIETTSLQAARAALQKVRLERLTNRKVMTSD